MLVLGEVLWKADRLQVEAAEQCILKGISMVDELGCKPEVTIGHTYLGEFLADAGREEEALEHLKKAEEMGMEMGMVYWLDRTKEALARIELK